MGEPAVLMLSGAGLPERVWEPVRAGLPRGTVSVVATPPRGRAALSDYATSAMEQAAQRAGSGPLVVLAHSSGGAVAAQLMAQAGDRVVGILGVCAVFPRPGRSFVGTMPLPARALLPVVLRVAGTRPPDGAIRNGLGAGLPVDVVQALVEDYLPESPALFLDRAGTPVLPAVRRYLLTTQDREVPPALQRRSAATLQAQHLTEVAAGHLPMLEAPAAVVTEVLQLLDSVPG